MSQLKDLAVKALKFADFTIERLKDAVFWVDSEAHIVRFNEACCEWLAYSGDELLAMKIYEIDLDSQPSNWQQQWAALKEKRALTSQTNYRTKTGQIFPVEVSSNYIEFEVNGYSCIIARDISERQQAAKEIESLAKFPAENPNPILRISKEGKIIYANEGSAPLLKAWGFGNDCFLPEELRKLTSDLFKSMKSQETDVVFGQQVFSLLFTPIVDEGYINAYASDITERKHAEEDLRKALAEVEQLKNRREAENVYLQEEIKVDHNFEEIITQSNILKRVLRSIEQVAATDTTVLILGETGTGKELLARAVHNLSNRRDQPLVKVNCAALPANLIESELFGHEKGAFTGALSCKIGRFELADGGTIFLDEIGDLPLELQAKLLRVLQEGEFERLGNPKSLKVDVRVIAATNRDLEQAIENGDFRQDLYYRLNVFPIESPPLRHRKEDIPVLVKHFMEKFNAKTGKKVEAVPHSVMETLQAYDWLGNVRELENIILRAIIISPGKRLQLGDWLSQKTTESGSTEVPTLEDLEKQHILQVLELTNGRVRGKNGAAEILNLKPTTLESRMLKLGIKRTK